MNVDELTLEQREAYEIGVKWFNERCGDDDSSTAQITDAVYEFGNIVQYLVSEELTWFAAEGAIAVATQKIKKFYPLVFKE